MGITVVKVSLIIPIYNESGHLGQFLKQIDELDLGIAKELVFVDDCSTDGSYEILKAFSFKSEHQINRHPINQGKGAAIQLGIGRAKGEILGVQDADFEYDMNDIPALIAPLIADRADVVYGSRFKKSGEQVHRTFHYLVNRFLTILSNFCTGIYLTDMETCYKFFKRDILCNIHLDAQRFGFEPEITAKIAHLKLRIMEVGISYYPRNYHQGKKITWKDGVAAIRHILYFSLMVKPEDFIKNELPATFRPTQRQWL
jgi:glycosyltransferase involved in cell wall biosynthesis